MKVGNPRCAVVGAANIDIGGFSAGRLSMRDSNPGKIRMSAGGVGRNIACNLARLGVDTQLIAALGGDAFADVIRRDCAAAGVGLERALVFEDAASSAYLFIDDAGGDMQLAVNDMGICDSLTPEALAPCVETLNAMDAVILDCNLSAGTLTWLSNALTVPLIADAVSAAKAGRLAGALPRLRCLKPNALEAEALTGEAVHGEASARRAAEALVEAGVARVFITLGERGVCCADSGQTLLIPGAPIRLVNATGAGDAFTAALAWAELRGLGLRDSAVAGLAAASIATEATLAVNPDMSEANLLERIERISARLGRSD